MREHQPRYFYTGTEDKQYCANPDILRRKKHQQTTQNKQWNR